MLYHQVGAQRHLCASRKSRQLCRRRAKCACRCRLGVSPSRRLVRSIPILQRDLKKLVVLEPHDLGVASATMLQHPRFDQCVSKQSADKQETTGQLRVPAQVVNSGHFFRERWRSSLRYTFRSDRDHAALRDTSHCRRDAKVSPPHRHSTFRSAMPNSPWRYRCWHWFQFRILAKFVDQSRRLACGWRHPSLSARRQDHRRESRIHRHRFEPQHLMGE